jgi:hypothetical protein
VRRHEYLDVLHANDLLCGPLGEVGSMPQSMTHRS